ncbi:MAG: hypothetical protein AAGF73_07885 [Actinomycetota bacterium]
MDPTIDSVPVPRAGIDHIRCARQALAAINTRPPRPGAAQISVLALDREHRGVALMTVADPPDRDAVVTVATLVANAHQRTGRRRNAVVLASFRPGDDADLSDIDRWIECDSIFDEIGVDLLEWFVIGARLVCPREFTAERPRWRP